MPKRFTRESSSSHCHERVNARVASVIIALLAVAACSSTVPATPCQSAAAGSANSGGCAITPTLVYATRFAAAESPLSEGNKWVDGRTVGIDWHDVQATPGEAFAADVVTGYDDDIAVLSQAFPANQYVQGTVHRAAAYSPNVSHEIELLLHFQITPHVARGYEVLWGQSGEINIVRWNGPLGDYTPLIAVQGPNVGPAIDGDVLRAEIVNGAIRVFKNGSLVLTGPKDMRWTDGAPGIGFWPKPGATLASYGWTRFEAGSL